MIDSFQQRGIYNIIRLYITSVFYQKITTGPTSKYRGLFQSLNVIANEEGIKALW